MQPNILFLMADQFRFDALGAVGGRPWTPHLDRIAARGVVFGNAITNSPICMPARISLATGLYPHQTGVWGNDKITTLNPEFANWMQAVAARGYRTSLFGKTHLHPQVGDLRDKVPLMNRYGLQTVDETCGPKASRTVLSNMTALWEERGVWDAYRRDMEDRVGRGSRHLARPSVLPLDLYYDVYVGQAAVRHLRDLPAGAPWFCWVSFAGPHAPWDAPEPYASMYAPEQMPAPTPRSTRSGRMRQSADDRKPPPSAGELARMRANYAGNVTLIDAQIGEILAAVERRGDLANTFIVFTSDHGEMNGDHGLFGKSVPFDASLKVPLVAAGPTGGGVQGGVRVDSLVELIDVGATIADYAGARLPEASCARSLRPIVEGKTPAVREFAISEIDERHLIVTPRWKAEFDRGLAATLLWDRANDPLELVDLSQDPGHGAVLDELRRTMAEFLAATPPSPNAVLRHQAMG